MRLYIMIRYIVCSAILHFSHMESCLEMLKACNQWSVLGHSMNKLASRWSSRQPLFQIRRGDIYPAELLQISPKTLQKDAQLRH